MKLKKKKKVECGLGEGQENILLGGWNEAATMLENKITTLNFNFPIVACRECLFRMLRRSVLLKL